MKKFSFAFAFAFLILSCSAQDKFATKFKGANPTVINGQVTTFVKNEFGTYTVSVITREYGKVQIHWVPCTAYLISIPVYVAKNGELHYRKT